MGPLARFRQSGLWVFGVLWLGQAVSNFGSNITGFALGVWVYRTTGSATKFALLTFFFTMPGLLAAPIAGALVDRWNRRSAILLGDGCDTLTKVLLIYLVATQRLALWQIYLILPASSIFHAFQVPAIAASTPLLVPKRHLGRANGWMLAGTSGSLILAPLAAGVLLDPIGFRGIVGIDLATALFGLATLLAVRIPRPLEQAMTGHTANRSVLASAYDGWYYLRERGGLLALLALVAALNLCVGIVYVLLAPMVLSFASSAELGTVLACTSGGTLAGSIAMSIWGGPRRRVRGIIVFVALQSIILAFGVARPSIPRLAVAAFAYTCFHPMVVSSGRTLWQSKVAPAMQGRVFALSTMLAASTLPLAALTAGPLADRFFEPWMAPGGALATSAGRLLGVGQGRGIALLFVLVAGAMLAIVFTAARYRPLVELEDEVPDAVEDKRPVALEGLKEGARA